MKVPRLKNQLNAAIKRIAAPDSVYVQINGCQPAVQVGEVVCVNQLIAKSKNEGELERRIHSPYNGTIVFINDVNIQIKGEWPVNKNQSEHLKISDLDAEFIRQRCFEAGIVGMGGAMTPTFKKLNPNKPIDTVLVNISESEPFLTCDHRVLEEYPSEITLGLELAKRAVGATDGLIAGKTNDYTSGYERFLVEEILGRKVPANSRPTDVGVLVLNLQTVRAIYLAVYEGQALTQRVITVDGEGIKNPGNYLVPLGCRIGHILTVCEWDSSQTAQLIIGGPMMGELADENSTVKAGTGGVLALSEEQSADIANNPCMRCGLCMDACPLNLAAGQMERYPSADLLDCIECGACQFVCPAERPIITNIQKAKEKYLKKTKDKQ